MYSTQKKHEILKSLQLPLSTTNLTTKSSTTLFPNLGVRKAMEDFTINLPDILNNNEYSFYCILDGHGGSKVSKYIKMSYPKLLKIKLKTYKKAYKMKNILKMTIENLEKQIKMIGGRNMGSTFCGLLIDKKNKKCYTINIGDSKLCSLKYNFLGKKLKTEFLTEDHKISNFKEKERILKKGGVIINERLGGNLIISRSLGDFDMKKYGLISTPDLEEFFLKERRIFFLASDGIWDVLGRKDVEEICKGFKGNDLEVLGKVICDLAVEKGSLDNISLIIVSVF